VIPQGCVKIVCSILSPKTNVNVVLMSSPLSPSPSPGTHSVYESSSKFIQFLFLISHNTDTLAIVSPGRVYYESIKRDPKIRGIKKCRCDERLQTKTKEFTRLPYTFLWDSFLYYKSKARAKHWVDVNPRTFSSLHFFCFLGFFFSRFRQIPTKSPKVCKDTNITRTSCVTLPYIS
jgi:hypothetical protein